ncbi:MAG: glycosyltransferase family 4 protein, partial [Nitrososphaeria archaeon]
VAANFLIREWKKNGVNISIFYTPSFLKSFTFSEVFKGTLNVIFNKLNYNAASPDILVSFDPYPIDVITIIRLSKKLNVPCTVYFHHITPDIRFYAFRRGLFRVILNRLYFRFMIKIIQHYKIPIFLDNPNTGKGLKVKVYPNLLALGKIRNISNASDKKYDVSYVGRLENHKGVEDIIDVINILKKKYGINVKAILVGPGNEKYVKKLNIKIKKYGLQGNIIFTGFVKEEEKWRILSESKVFLFLSYEEGWAISVMEAASMGLPIVAYDLPAYYYLKDNFFKVNPGDTKAAAEKIAYILNNYKEALAIGDKAKEVVDKFDQEFIAKQQLIFYKRIIEDYNGYKIEKG